VLVKRYQIFKIFRTDISWCVTALMSRRPKCFWFQFKKQSLGWNALCHHLLTLVCSFYRQYYLPVWRHVFYQKGLYHGPNNFASEISSLIHMYERPTTWSFDVLLNRSTRLRSHLEVKTQLLAASNSEIRSLRPSSEQTTETQLEAKLPPLRLWLSGLPPFAKSTDIVAHHHLNVCEIPGLGNTTWCKSS